MSIDHKKHLQEVVKAQRELSKEIIELQQIIDNKKETFQKAQGIYEYLVANGVKLDEEESQPDGPLNNDTQGEYETSKFK
jgi:hypothetical protein